MTLEKFTIKAQQAVQEAVNTAQRNGQQTIEPVHLLAGMMNKAKDVVNFLLQKLGVNAQQIDMPIISCFDDVFALFGVGFCAGNILYPYDVLFRSIIVESVLVITNV